MKRYTLEELVSTELGIEVYKFAQIVGLSRDTLRRLHNNRKLAVKLLISGYKSEVMRESATTKES